MNLDILPHKSIHHGNNLRKIRETLGLTQEQLAEKARLKQPSISRFESMEEIDDENLDTLSNVLGVPKQLIQGMQDNSPVNFGYNNTNCLIGYIVMNDTDQLKALFSPKENNAEVMSLLKQLQEEIKTLKKNN